MTQRPDPERTEQQRAFDRMADSLGFTLEHSSFEVGEHTDLGLLLGPLASPVTEFVAVPTAEAPGEDEDQAIEATIRGWETLEPADFAENFTRYATDPFLLIGTDSVGTVGEGTVESSDEFEKRLAEYPLHSPRQIEISNVRIVHIRGSRAVATYTVDESYTDGTRIHSNAVAVLAKLSAGWRIVIATDHLAPEGSSVQSR